MKVKLVSERTSISGYYKLYLSFVKPKTDVDKKILRLLPTQNVYLGGNEPKFSLFLGSKPKEKEVVYEQVKTFNTATGSGKTALEIQESLGAEYEYSCRCGCCFTSKRKLNHHQTLCLVLKEMKPRIKRIVHALGEKYVARLKSKAKKKRGNTKDKFKERKRTKNTKGAKKKVSRRSTRSRKK